MKQYLLLFCCCMSLGVWAQDPISPEDRGMPNDKSMKSLLGMDQDSVTADMFKRITYKRDTVLIDSSLTIQKQYRHNYLRKDGFELQSFANVGHTYNRLGTDIERNDFYPGIGAGSKYLGYMDKRDIEYYHVPTPATELMYKTTLEQGQILDALLTFNMSERLNISLAYKGFKSLGKYQYSLADSGHFRVTTNFTTKNNRYSLRAHMIAQNMMTEENGGLLLKDIQFESGDPEFKDRSRVDVVFQDAQNTRAGKSYFLDHGYELLQKKEDTVRGPSLSVGHQLGYETQYYDFTQGAQNDYFGPVLISDISDQARLKTLYNQLNVRYANKGFGAFKGYLDFNNYNYFFKSLIVTDEGVIQNQLKGDQVGLGAAYSNKVGPFSLDVDGQLGLSGDLSDYKGSAVLGYRYDADHSMEVEGFASSVAPDFAYQLYQSAYVNYNWQNTDDFGQEKALGLKVRINTEKYGRFSMTYGTVYNQAYFRSTASQDEFDAGQGNAHVKPFQLGMTLNYYRAKYQKEFKFGDFALDNTLLYQHVSQPIAVMNLPTFTTRNTLYYSKEIFRNAMLVQTGITFKYFTKYYMDAYNPLLGSFYVQDREEFGGYPMLDFFLNARVRTMRIFFKLEHFNSSFTGYNFYASPDYPYRDFVLRFGIAWNFFG